jgi:colanic acid biosynthesis glycosyl transferase WcaI
MRVLLLNQCFYPDVVATAQHGWDLARRLSADGHEVTAIASRSIYGTSGATLPPEEVMQGIAVRRVGSSRFGKSSIFARAVDFLDFHWRAAVAALRLPRQDVVVCFTTPPFISIVGIALQALRGTRCIYWAMDLYPEVPVACGVMKAGAMHTRVCEALNRLCLRRSKAVVVLGRCMQERVLSKGIHRSATRLIRPWAEPGATPTPRSAPNRYRREWDVGDRILVMYSGNFGLGHDFETIVDGIVALREDPRFLFALVGGGKRKPEVLHALRSKGVTNIVDAPYQPRESLGELLGAADVHLVSLASSMEGVMVPSKFFGIAAIGRPVLYVGSPSGEIARCIAEANCGWVVAPGRSADFSAALLSATADPGILDSMGERARRRSDAEWDAKRALDDWSRLVASA